MFVRFFFLWPKTSKFWKFDEIQTKWFSKRRPKQSCNRDEVKTLPCCLLKKLKITIASHTSKETAAFLKNAFGGSLDKLISKRPQDWQRPGDKDWAASSADLRWFGQNLKVKIKILCSVLDYYFWNCAKAHVNKEIRKGAVRNHGGLMLTLTTWATMFSPAQQAELDKAILGQVVNGELKGGLLSRLYGCISIQGRALKTIPARVRRDMSKFFFNFKKNYKLVWLDLSDILERRSNDQIDFASASETDVLQGPDQHDIDSDDSDFDDDEPFKFTFGSV